MVSALLALRSESKWSLHHPSLSWNEVGKEAMMSMTTFLWTILSWQTTFFSYWKRGESPTLHTLDKKRERERQRLWFLPSF